MNPGFINDHLFGWVAVLNGAGGEAAFQPVKVQIHHFLPVRIPCATLFPNKWAAPEKPVTIADPLPVFIHRTSSPPSQILPAEENWFLIGAGCGDGSTPVDPDFPLGGEMFYEVGVVRLVEHVGFFAVIEHLFPVRCVEADSIDPLFVAVDAEVACQRVFARGQNIIVVEPLRRHEFSDVTPQDVGVAVPPEIILVEQMWEHQPVGGFEVAEFIGTRQFNGEAEYVRCDVGNFRER